MKSSEGTRSSVLHNDVVQRSYGFINYHFWCAKNSSGFTLLELLVVIAIVGFLSAIAVTNLNSAREKARIARGLEFEASIRHILGPDLIGEWTFDGSSGVKDSSGFGNDLTFGLGSSQTASDCISDSCLQLDGSLSAGATTASSVTADFSDNKFTAMAWVYSNQYGAGRTTVISYNANFLFRFEGTSSNPNYLYSSPPNLSISTASVLGGLPSLGGPGISAQKWHHIAVIYDGVWFRQFVDGVEISAETKIPPAIDGSLVFTMPNFVSIGSRINGKMDSVRFYNNAPIVGSNCAGGATWCINP